MVRDGTTSEASNLEQKEENLDVLVSTQTVIKRALDKLGYPEQVYELLKEPMRMMRVRIPVRMDDGSVQVFTGYRSQHNDAVGPTKGGVRFHPDVNEKEVKALSIWMSLKAGIVDLPYGGGKGGLSVIPGRCPSENWNAFPGDMYGRSVRLWDRRRIFRHRMYLPTPRLWPG